MKRPYVLGEIKQGRIVFVGPSGCGKTTLLMRYLNIKYNNDYVPTVIETVEHPIMAIGQTEVNIVIWDTAGTSSRITEASVDFLHMDVIVFSYAIDGAYTIDELIRYYEEFRKHYAPNTPVFVMSMKADTRTFGDDNYLSYDDGQFFADSINAIGYSETSAFKNIGIDFAFQKIATFILNTKFILPEDKPYTYWGCC